jgi:predicted lipid carrier protein YhbT
MQVYSGSFPGLPMTEVSLASEQEVEERLEALIARLDANENATGRLRGSLPEDRILSLRVTDLGADYWTSLEGGRLGELQRGAPGQAHIRITASSDDLVQLVDGNGSLFSAYLAGRVRIEASFSDLLRLRKLA